MVLVLAALAAAVAAAMAWYLLPAQSEAATARVATAGAAQQMVIVHQAATPSGDLQAALEDFGHQVGDHLPLRARPWLGLVQTTTIHDKLGDNQSTPLPVAYRDDFCAHARITGACPAAGQAAVERGVADRLGLKTGNRITVTAGSPLTLQITGIYQVNAEDPYWSDPFFQGAGGNFGPVFTPLASFRPGQLNQPQFTYGVAVPTLLLSGAGGFDVNGVLNSARPWLEEERMDVSAPAGPVAEAAGQARYDVGVDVLTLFGQVLAVALLALGLAGRFTGRDRRADAGLLLLRGSNRLRLVGLGSGQYLFPLLGGALLGTPVGVLAARLLAGRWPLRSDLSRAIAWSAAAVAAVLVGGLVVLLLVDAFAHRGPVAGMLRRVPSMRRDWRSLLVDVVLVILAGAAVYQVRTGGPGNGLGVIAPVLVALAVGVVLARILRAIVDRAGTAALRGGRLRAGLTAVQISRQPGADRVFALLVVAVAAFALSSGGWIAGRQERTTRAEVELGAPRVLTVQAESRTQLLEAVRKADPSGREAMAAVLDPVDGLLAVDSTRLAAVAHWRPEYGPIAALNAPAPRRPPLITGASLSLRVDSARTDTIPIRLVLQNETGGQIVQVTFRGVRPGSQTVTAPVSGCTGGCRLVGIQPIFPLVGGDTGVHPVGGAVTVHGLDQQGPAATILDPAALADITRWRTDFIGLALDVLAGPGGLRIAPQVKPGGNINPRVYALDAPLPLPLLVAGPPPANWRLQGAYTDLFAENHTPVREAATAQVLPELGNQGVLADLDAVRRLAQDSVRPATYQVWLAAGAPPSVVTALTRNNLTIVGDHTATARARDLAQDSGLITGPFRIYSALITLLLAAAMLAAAGAAERGPLTEQLLALRTQGLSRRTARMIRIAGPATLAAAGLLGGLLAAVLARWAADVTAPVFADGWHVLPPPGVLGWLALALTVLAGLIVLSPAAGLPARGGLR